MLSLVGSIQPDPFSPEHVPQATVGSKPKSTEESHKVEDGELAEDMIAEEESSDEEDPFAALGRAKEEAAEVDKAKKAQEQLKLKGDKKRKKKEKKGDGDDKDKVHVAAEGEKKPSKKKRKTKAE